MNVATALCQAASRRQRRKRPANPPAAAPRSRLIGFWSWTRQKLRLRGIDAPELATEAGRRCREFVAEVLRDTPSITVRTTRPDKYGRYLADVYTLPGETDGQTIVDNGVFLNGELLERGLATPFAG